MTGSLSPTPRVLIVDDSPINVKVLNQALRDDYEVFFATSGEDALQVISTAVPDIVLLDVVMPGMDGYEICRVLKGDPVTRDIPVIFITGMTDEADEAVGLELGAVDYITKPFSPGIVRLRVRNHIELKRQKDLLREISHRDGLTGLANRRAFDEQIEQEWRRSVRAQGPLSLLMVDVDQFKSYNDKYGHLAGDDCLRRVAQAMYQACKRAGDMVARYGGEEFACILPKTDHEGACVVASAMRANVEALKIRNAVSRISLWVTVSVGAATAWPTRAMQAEGVLTFADSLLYEAKRTGRNRVIARKIP